jgi:DNA mismatch repair protein MSH6
MDELGRGTSTFDGTAIASATVQHLVERNKCLTLFATHYHSLLEEWKMNSNVKLGHMECLVGNNSDSSEAENSDVTFLYTLGNGVCPKSFGINVARLAGLPDDVLIKAKRISAEFEVEMSCEMSLASGQKQSILSAMQAGAWDDVVRIWENLQLLE